MSQLIKRRAVHFAIGSIGICVSAAAIYWLIPEIAWAEFFDSMKALPAVSLAASALLLLLSLPLRALQARLLLGNPAALGFFDALRAVCYGHAGNLLLPWRGGEAIKAVSLARSMGLPFETMLPSIFVARLQDLPPVFLIGGLGAVSLASGEMAGREDALLHGGTLSMGAVAVAAALGLPMTFPLWPACLEGLRAWAGRLPQGISSWALARIGRAEVGLAMLRSARVFWASQAIAFLCWALFAAAALPLLATLAGTWASAFYAAVLFTAVTTLIQLIPSAPAALGTYEAAGLASLSYSLPAASESTALAVVVVVHVLGTLVPALPGILWGLLSYVNYVFGGEE